MPLPGVRITAIIHKPVLCRLLLTGNVRTANLITKVVKKTGREPAENKDMSTPVLRDGFMPPQTVVRGIILTVNAVPLRHLQVVRLIIRSLVIRHAAHPVLILADIPATAVVMTTVHQGLLKTIQEQRHLIPNAEQPASAVRAVRPEQVHHITERFLQLPNAGLVTNAVIHVLPDQKAQVAEADMNLTVAVLPNAEAPVTPAANILTPTLARVDINLLHADQATQLPAPDLNLVLVAQLPVPAINAPKILAAAIITTIITPEILEAQERQLRQPQAAPTLVLTKDIYLLILVEVM